MSLQFLLGNSGSGKSEYLFRKIVEEAQEHPFLNYYIIVPEQFTLQTQKKLVELSANQAIMNIDVLSFKRLAYRIFDELGIQALQILDETDKNLVIRNVSQDLSSQLKVLHSHMNRIGYINEVKSVISEFIQYNVTVDTLREFLEEATIPGTLSKKLEDVCLIYEAYEKFMKDQYITSEELLEVLISVVHKTQMMKNATLVFDEFTGFTPLQNRLLLKLMPMVSKIYIALTIDSKEDFFHSKGIHELFHMPKECIRQTMELAKQAGIEIEDPIVLEDAKNCRFRQSEDLAFLEQNLFRRTYKKKHETTGDILLYNMKNPMEEVTRVARKILEYVQKDGYRYADIAVVTGNVEGYGNYVETIFSAYQIPYYLDATSNIVYHPFVEFIKATLDVLLYDFSYESVMRLLRTGYFPVSISEIDYLENYILATGIRGRKMWEKNFTRKSRNNQFDLEIVNRTREIVYEHLEILTKAFSIEQSVCGQITALYQFITGLDIEKQLLQKEQEFLDLNQEARAREYGQIYKTVMMVLEKYMSLLGESTLSLEEFVEILSAGLDASKLLTIPPAQDSVTIGDIERTRLSSLKILFFVGVNDGVIPKSAGKNGIISEYEREILNEQELNIAPGARDQIFMQKYYLYLNLTKPQRKLEISYSRVDAQGKQVLPSYLIKVIERMFPMLQEVVIDSIYEQLNFYSKEAMIEYLIHGQRDENWFEIVNYFMQKKDAAVLRLLEAEFEQYVEEPLQATIAQELYGLESRYSITRLEQYVRCAYKHFLQYGIGLKEREEAKLSKLDIGNIYHDAIYLYSRKLQEKHIRWHDITQESQREYAAKAFAEAIERNHMAENASDRASKYSLESMERVFQQVVQVLTEQVKVSNFEPKEFEIGFKKDSQLVGKIDRVDLAYSEKHDQYYIKVIDYKTGKVEFDMEQIYHGLQLQLITYMNQATDILKEEIGEKELLPAGVLYCRITEPILEDLKVHTDEERWKELLKAYLPDGMVNSDSEIIKALDGNMQGASYYIPVACNKSGENSNRSSKVMSTEEFHLVGEYTDYKIKNMKEQIQKGDIGIHPIVRGSGNDQKMPCDYCPYAGVCRIQSKLPGYEGRRLEKMNKDTIIDQMKTALAIDKQRSRKGEQE